MCGVDRAGTAQGGVWRAVRWPLAATTAAALLVVAAFVLDSGSGTARDYALVIGAPALYVLLPLALLWLAVALVRNARRGARR
jgi:hypothetical protein